MINAKDEFSLEREMINEMQYYMNNSNLSSEELEIIVDQLNGEITEREYYEIQKRLIDRQIHPIDRLKNGEFMNVTQTNIAILKAVNRD